MTIESTNNYFVKFGQIPAYKEANPQQSTKAVKLACERALAVANELGASSEGATWDNLIAPLDEVLEKMSSEYSVIAHLSAVSASKEWDAANQESIQAVTIASAQIAQHQGLYKRMCELAKNANNLSAARKKILKDNIADFELSGVGLPDKERKIFATNEEKLSQLNTQFEQNVRNATAAWHLELDNEDDLGKMPDDVKNIHRTENGFRFGLLDPSYIAFMTYCTNRNLREKMMRARNARASDLNKDEFDNTTLLTQILNLRNEQAKLLGFADPAQMILSKRMAKDNQTVLNFLNKLTGLAKNKASTQFNELSKFAKEKLHIDQLEVWDLTYAIEEYKQEVTGISDAQIRPYFGVTKVMQGLFACIENLFQVTTIKRDDLVFWDEQVICLEVNNAGGEKIGTLIMDLFAREHKQGGAWAHGAQERAMIKQKLQLPTALINCNFTKPSKGEEARLSWIEIITLFHEAGHAFHHLLTKVDDYSASGLNNVEWDAIELPSQFLENFAWREEIALNMSSHQDTNEPLPQAMFQKLVAQKTFLSGLMVTRQLAFAKFDLEVHQRKGEVNVLKLWEEIRNDTMVVPYLIEDRFPCAFTHIFAGGYAAGYYGYLWAEVLAADAYELFTSPKADLKGLGKKFAKEVLERGGTRDASENFRALVGRDPDPQALLRRLALA